MGTGKRYTHRIYEHPHVYQVYLMHDAYGSRKQEALQGVETTCRLIDKATAFAVDDAHRPALQMPRPLGFHGRLRWPIKQTIDHRMINDLPVRNPFQIIGPVVRLYLAEKPNDSLHIRRNIT